MSDLTLSPGLAQIFYPQRRKSTESELDRFAINLLGNTIRPWQTRLHRFKNIVPHVHEIERPLRYLSRQELEQQTLALRHELRAQGFRFDLVAKAFALTREYADRTIGMRHFDVQLIGGWVLFNGMVAEMQTGEGKTLVATLPACAAALAGIPVHIITVNDYLARRDADWMRPIYHSLGLTVGIITHGMTKEERRLAYHCDVTYCTNKEITFDYLKDWLVLGHFPGQIRIKMKQLYGSDNRLEQLCLRGLVFAIVDEIDSVLIDEARTPLIIAGSGCNVYENEIYRQALELAQKLTAGEDFILDHSRKKLELTRSGEIRLANITQSMGGCWARKVLREELVRQALVALNLFFKDKEYLVREDKVEIIDEFTGRVMTDRQWEQGLHQLIETKECCQITSQNETLARISYQRFFRRYIHLSGMTGTAKEVANELWAVYRLQVVAIPTNKPLIRYAYPAKVFRRAKEKWQTVVEHIAQLHAQERPILVGTRSVAASENLSRLLSEAGLPHRVLNARQDQEEAEIIAQAGQRGQITVATNMAGRGTDILLGPGVKELGGLHVIATERHEARRIDRQLFGRCGRQGDPGSYEIFASLEDEILLTLLDSSLGWLARLILQFKLTPEGKMENFLATLAQKLMERRHFQIRRDLLKFDESFAKAMAFSGQGE